MSTDQAVKDFLSKEVNPTLLKGLTELCKSKPGDPMVSHDFIVSSLTPVVVYYMLTFFLKLKKYPSSYFTYHEWGFAWNVTNCLNLFFNFGLLWKTLHVLVWCCSPMLMSNYFRLGSLTGSLITIPTNLWYQIKSSLKLISNNQSCLFSLLCHCVFLIK